MATKTQQFVNKPGGVIAHRKDGSAVRLTYGQPVPDDLADYVDVSTFSDSQDRGYVEASQEAAAQERAALAENGQVNSSSSPVPGNYAELSEDGAASLIANLGRHPESQAAVVKHEILFGGNRQKVIDAASAYARESARRQIDALTPAESDTSGDLSGEPVRSAGDPDAGGWTRDDAEKAQQIQGRLPSPTSSSDDDASRDGGEATSFAEATVPQLDAYAEQHEIEDYPKSANKDDKVAALVEAHGDPQTPFAD